jgi:hypothetical protein
MLEDGTAKSHAPSVVMMAAAEVPVLDDAAVFWSMTRAAAQSACNRVYGHEGAAVVARTRAFPEAPSLDAPLYLHPHTEHVVEGIPLDHALAAETDVVRARQLLVAWLDLVDLAVEGQPAAAWDLIPRNVLVRPDGSLRAIDQEWHRRGASSDLVQARGFFWLAADLVGAQPLPSWIVGNTVREVADYLRHLSGRQPDPFWLDAFLDQEADDASWVAPVDPRQSRSFHARKNRGALMSVSQSCGGHEATPHDEHADDATLAALRGVIATVSAENDQLREQVRVLELDRRHIALVHRDHVLGLNSELETSRERLARTQRQLSRSRAKVGHLQKIVADMRSSTTWRLGRMVVAPLSRLRGSSSS